MAQMAVTITYPDDKQQDILASLRARYGQILANGVYRDRTPQECKAAFDLEVRNFLRTIYLNHKKTLKQAEASQDDLNATV